ncbi:hypothetical protein [Aestuariicoccus sp. MJ-SS9]|uniref:hypothetical protein n=1 Tax=Aestuariicoccus sp. MJ-SS9 TaxID=3079855 RepID=UPI0029084645|nr:hypothetical protein [Aestuariicoccus sp. MJ-SS9]MDU8913090.1 hypothetical protein [Aestuariicoccus sp. MJ-SS9]
MLKSTLLASALVLTGAVAAQAVDYRTALESYLDGNIMPWAGDERIVVSILAQNDMTSALDAAGIDALDQAWRGEIGGADTPTITPVLANPTSDFLREIVNGSGGTITGIFLMDAVGLNVATSGVTSDYWQGDEDKHQKTYGMGPGAVHYGDIEFDESSQSYQAQISVAVTDPATGKVIGAMTVGVNADSLM